MSALPPPAPTVEVSRPRSSSWKRPGAAAARIAVIVGVLVLVVRWTGVMESIAFIHPGAKQFGTPPGVEDVWFATTDGLRLHGWFMPGVGRKVGDGPGPAVLHCHGNMESVDVHASWSRFIRGAGISVLVFDYRSFGRSANGGRFLTRADLLRDSRAALDYLESRKDVDPVRVGLYGVSLGGSFALALAAERPEVKAVCTVATFCSWPCVARDYAPVLADLLIPSGQAQEDNVALLGKRPLMVVHGDRDSIVPYRHAGVLMEAAAMAGVSAELVTVTGAGHLDVLERRRDVPGKIRGFFAKALGVTEQPPIAVPAETRD